MTSSTTTAGAAELPPSPDAPRVLSVRTVHEGWGRFLIARLLLGDGSEIEREVEDHGVAVAVLPYDPERREALLVRQPRPPALLAAGLTTVLEALAGRLEGPDPAACAAREAREECGWCSTRSSPWGKAGPCRPCRPSASTYSSHPTGRQTAQAPAVDSHEGEDIAVEVLPLDALSDMAERRLLSDMKIALLVHALRHRRPALFTH